MGGDLGIMTSQTVISIIIGAITLILSVGTSAIMIGVKWGRLETQVADMEKDLREIKGMFRLTLKE
jgi:NADH:ubiquinone oxidoreductase subunit K